MILLDTLPASVTINSLINSTILIVSALGGVMLAYLTTRRSIVSALKEEAAGWSRLAAMKEEELKSVNKRMGILEEDNTITRRDLGELRSLNLTLQKENSELRQKVTLLTDRIAILEKGI
jgi:hypothetical protein